MAGERLLTVGLLTHAASVPARWRGLVYGYTGALRQAPTRGFGYGGPRPRATRRAG